MFKIKRIAALILAFAMAFAFAACNKDKKEEPETESTTEKATYNETAPAEPLATSKDEMMYPEYTYVPNGEDSGSYTEIIDTMEFVYQNYYGHNNSYSKIIDIQVNDIDRLGDLECYATVEMLGVGEGDSMRIGYRCYDAEGEIVKNIFFTVWYDGEVKAGDTIDMCRFDVPKETVRVEFFDYTES